MIIRSTWISLLTLLGFGSECFAADGPRLDQIQVIGSHNSYHLAPHPNVQGMLGQRMKSAAQALDYTHRPLSEQFGRLGLRQIELDVFADPEGGRYAEPLARKILKRIGKEPGPDPDADGRLRKPGFKVFHIQDMDYQSTVSTLLEALHQVHDWSVAHPRHVPILVLLELKDEPVLGLPTRRPRSVKRSWMPSTPRSALSSAPTTSSPPTTCGAMTPHSARRSGLEAGPRSKLREARSSSLSTTKGTCATSTSPTTRHCEGEAMFVSVPPDHPAAAWMKRNDPIRQFDEIQQLVKGGFLVRTRADADTAEARKDDPTRREKALASGAQFISTDFPEPRPDSPAMKSVSLEGSSRGRIP